MYVSWLVIGKFGKQALFGAYTLRLFPEKKKKNMKRFCRLRPSHPWYSALWVKTAFIVNVLGGTTKFMDTNVRHSQHPLSK